MLLLLLGFCLVLLLFLFIDRMFIRCVDIIDIYLGISVVLIVLTRVVSIRDIRVVIRVAIRVVMCVVIRVVIHS